MIWIKSYGKDVRGKLPRPSRIDSDKGPIRLRGAVSCRRNYFYFPMSEHR